MCELNPFSPLALKFIRIRQDGNSKLRGPSKLPGPREFLSSILWVAPGWTGAKPGKREKTEQTSHAIARTGAIMFTSIVMAARWKRVSHYGDSHAKNTCNRRRAQISAIYSEGAFCRRDGNHDR